MSLKQSVGHQVVGSQLQAEPREYLAHLVIHFRRQICGEANAGPNRFHQNRTLSWLISIPRSCNMSSTFRSESGKADIHHYRKAN